MIRNFVGLACFFAAPFFPAGLLDLRLEVRFLVEERFPPGASFLRFMEVSITTFDIYAPEARNVTQTGQTNCPIDT